MRLAHYFCAAVESANPAVQIALFTSVAFIFGKILMGLYFKNIAMSSVYGAAGTLLVFLIWAYYSSFMLFLSLELYLFLHPHERLGKVVQPLSY